MEGEALMAKMTTLKMKERLEKSCKRRIGNFHIIETMTR